MSCPRPSHLTIDLGGGQDTLYARIGTLPMSVAGGAGDDHLTGRGQARMLSGPGADVFEAVNGARQSSPTPPRRARLRGCEIVRRS